MRMKSAESARLVSEQKASGQTVPEFCASRGLDQKTFYVWRQRAKKGSPSRFARVEPAATSRRIELELSGGTLIRIPIEDLKAVLEALR